MTMKIRPKVIQWETEYNKIAPTTTTADSTPSFQFIIKHFNRIQNTLFENVRKHCIIRQLNCMVFHRKISSPQHVCWAVCHFVPSHNIQTYIIPSVPSSWDRIYSLYTYFLKYTDTNSLQQIETRQIYINACAAFGSKIYRYSWIAISAVVSRLRRPIEQTLHSYDRVSLINPISSNI